MHFIQTYSFSGKLAPKGEAVLAALKKKYPEIKSLADVTPAVGIANAYDAMHLTALAIAKAGSTEGPKVRQGFYAIDKLRRPDQDLQASRSRPPTRTRSTSHDYSSRTSWRARSCR